MPPAQDLSKSVASTFSPAGLSDMFAAMDPMQLYEMIKQLIQPKPQQQVPLYNPALQQPPKPDLRQAISGEY